MKRSFQAGRESGVSRVIGFSEEGERNALDYFKDRFENNDIETKEKEKTSEQLEIIRRINICMKTFIAQYGIESIDVNPNNIHFLDKEKFSEDALKKITDALGTENGFHSAGKQAICILKEYEDNKLSFLQTLVHEIIHMQAFDSFQKTDQEKPELDLHSEDGSIDSLSTRRVGFAIVSEDGKTEFFKFLNEAITTELAIRFERAYITSWPEVASNLEIRNEFINELIENEDVKVEDAQNTVAVVHAGTDTGYDWSSYSYHSERKQFNEVIDQLYLKNSDKFESREEIFTMFATAAMTGRLLPVARLIESTFGKGSFRAGGIRSGETSE